MNFIKKALIAIACVGAIVSTAQAAPINLAPVVYNPADIYISTSNSGVTFTQDISNFMNGFVVGFDTLNSARLSISLRDDQSIEIIGGSENYKFVLGSLAQTETGSGISSCIPFIGCANVIKNVDFNPLALADLALDGKITISVTSTTGDFTFDSASLTANVTRGTVPEPTTVALLGLGLLGFAASRRKSAKNKNA